MSFYGTQESKEFSLFLKINKLKCQKPQLHFTYFMSSDQFYLIKSFTTCTQFLNFQFSKVFNRMFYKKD